MKSTFSLFVTLMLSLSCFAQQDYVIDLNGRTLYGTVILSTPAANAVQISFKDSKGAVRRYRPDEIQLWSKGNSIFESKVYTISNRTGQMTFMKRLTPKEGKCQVFEHYNILGDVGYTQTLLEIDGKMEVVNYGKFRKQLTHYFQDYPELSEDIANRKYKKKQLLDIVERYNAWKEEQWKN